MLTKSRRPKISSYKRLKHLVIIIMHIQDTGSQVGTENRHFRPKSAQIVNIGSKHYILTKETISIIARFAQSTLRLHVGYLS